jgi:hypothetical protein
VISWRASHARPKDPAETINSFYHFGIVPATGKTEVNGTDPAGAKHVKRFRRAESVAWNLPLSSIPL